MRACHCGRTLEALQSCNLTQVQNPGRCQSIRIPASEKHLWALDLHIQSYESAFS